VFRRVVWAAHGNGGKIVRSGLSMSDSNKITFKASMPPIDSALRYSGAGNGARLQLDIPENQIEHAAWLIAMRQCRLIVTIEVEQDASPKGTIERGAKY
jgi:hypothetical protein